VVVHCHSQDFLGLVLPDNVLIEKLFYASWRRYRPEGWLGLAVSSMLLLDDIVAQIDTVAADIYAIWPLDYRAYIFTAAIAETTGTTMLLVLVAYAAIACLCWTHQLSLTRPAGK
jgi:hypothetical protein